MLGRRIPIRALLLRGAIPVLLGLALMASEPAARHLRLESAVLGSLPLADVAKVDVLGLHRDQRDPAELKPRSCFGLHHLGVLASRTDARGSIAFLFDLGRAAKDDWDEEAEVLHSGMPGETSGGEKQGGTQGGMSVSFVLLE